MTMTKEQILEHVSGINLFLTRGNDIVKVLMVDGNQSYNYFTVARLTGPEEDRNYEGIYALNNNGRYFTSGNESEYDLVALITADDLQQLTKPDKQPTSKPKFNIDLKQCIEDQTYLKTRDGEKALILKHKPNSNKYPFIGVIIETDGLIDVVAWTENGRYSNNDRNSLKDIVGLWEKGDE